MSHEQDAVSGGATTAVLEVCGVQWPPAGHS